MPSSKIKVLHVIETLALGGAERLLGHVIKGLDCEKFSLTVVCLYGDIKIPEAFGSGGFRVYSLGIKSPYNWPAAMIKLLALMRGEHFDIVHTHLFFANIYARIAARICGVKVIITTLHNPDYSFEDNGRLTYKLRKFIDKFSGKLCNNCFIAVSEFVKRDFQGQLGFENIKVIYNCVDSSRSGGFDKERLRRKRRELGLSPEDTVILNVGRLHAQKGQGYLLEAFSAVRGILPGCKLLVIGQGRLEQELKLKADALGLGRSVSFLGGRDDIPEIMSASDLFVSYPVYEGFGIAMVEAMSLGLPVVASGIDTFSEIITDGSDAIIVEKENPERLAGAIVSLLKDKNKMFYLGQNAAKTAKEKFDISVHMRKLEGLYLGAVSGVKTSCLVCGGTFFRPTVYGGYVYAGGKHSIVKCRGCGFMFLDPLPDKEALSKIYNEGDYFEAYHATANGLKSYIGGMNDYAAADRETVSLIKKYKAGGFLLDLGCAGGRFLLGAQAAGYSVRGIELNMNMAAYARDTLGLAVVCSEIGNANFSRGHFDVIHAADVLEHLPGLKKDIPVIREWLKDDGIFVIEQPLVYNRSLFNLLLKANMLFKKNKYASNPPAHLWEFTPGTLKRFLKEAGFDIVYCEVYETRAKPLSVFSKPTLKNRLGFYLKNLSGFISNLSLFKPFEMGNRAFVVCSKNKRRVE